MASDSDGASRATALARKLNAVREWRMRLQVLADTLRDEPPDPMVTTLRALLVLDRTRPTRESGAALEALAATLSTPDLLPYPVRMELYEAAVANGYDEIRRMLFEVSPSGQQPANDDPGAERPLEPRGRPLTLGERKSLARGHVRDKIALLARDPHPSVIEILLSNPHLTEREVLVIATQRPTSPEALTIVATSERWAKRYSVKRALALNPYTPAHLSVRLAMTLSRTDLRAIAADSNLPEPLRNQAEALLATAAE